MGAMLWFDRAGLDAADYEALRREVGARRPRVLAWAKVEDGVAAGLPDRLAVRRGDAWTHVAWDDVVSGGWDDQASRLDWVTGDGADGVALAEPGRLPELFRERVQASILLQQHLEIAGTGGVTVTARRNPADPRAEVRWVVLPRRGARLDDPRVAAVVEPEVARLRAEWEN